jgi:hypothetical protein
VDDDGARVRRFDLLDGGEDRAHAGLRRGIIGPLDAVLDVGGGERVAVVPLHALAQLERPRLLTLNLPFGGEAGDELAVGPAAREVVEHVERDADVVRRRAHVGIERRDVPTLGDQQLALLGGLGGGRTSQSARQGGGGAGQGRALEKISTSHCHTAFLLAEMWDWALSRACGLAWTPGPRLGTEGFGWSPL